jgi:hypothetical protein
MAGTVTVTEEAPFAGGSLRKIRFDWTSDAAGAADAVTEKAYNGCLERLVTIPDGVAAPTDNYDATLLDEDGADILMGAGANRDTANTEQVLASSLGCVANDVLALHITNAGNAKKGALLVYLR